MTDYSLKMQEVFRLAQFEAARFESSYLESWHVLLAMVEIDSSVAGLSLRSLKQMSVLRIIRLLLFWRLVKSLSPRVMILCF